MNRSPGPGPAILSRPAGQNRPTWRTINITPAERLGRAVVGLAAIITGAVLLAVAASVLAAALEALLVLAGLDLLATGALGHCPLYQKLGYLPPSLRRTR